MPPADASALEELLVRVWKDARAQWPTVTVPAEAFVKHLAERLPAASPNSPIDQLLAQLSLAELYLACACLQGAAPAIKLFEEHYLTKLRKLLGHRRQSPTTLDEICQLARVKILVATPEGPPKIAEYTGKGALLGWVRVTAVRIAIKLQASDKSASEEDLDVADSALPPPGVAPELDIIKQRHHPDLRQAMRDAFSSLSADDRHLLRLYFVDQLSMYELATLFGVSQPTISRRLKNARELVYQETRRKLQERLGLSQNDFQSFINLLDSQFELRISQLLGEEGPVPR
ncbi:sigma-70 family RNA polymerase sigma factor [Hyalangium sp.]|uniref:sigma-70 family RNA polymerase sigma factor n=1 Tax=Hyalangium sp. TaxID=2028555 RepID=UPI002D63F31B|nr:sigma-70 family RNA polymerase sigma factor [Hyalangium sp.]HYI00234.1 sigma-70 family RNA polymerase sigma factor [Hyalangium sp.]